MRTASVAVLVPILVASTFLPAHAQVDLAKALVGRWEGEIRKVHPKQALGTAWTLLIEQVREQGGKWAVERAQFGETGKPLRPIQVRVEVRGEEVTVTFAPPRSSATLRLSGGNVLVGSVHMATLGTSPMELKKVE